MDDVGNERVLKQRITLCYKVLQQYSWLLDSYILDFFTENHLQKLPATWQLQLKETSIEELGSWMNTSPDNYQHHRVWPLSLLSLHSILRSVPLNRVPNSKKSVTGDIIKPSSQTVGKSHKTICLKHRRLSNLFLKHVKPKKRLEVMKMAEVTAEKSYELGVHCIVDVGSGVGHLSRLLAYGYNLKVCCLETQLPLSQQATKIDMELELTAGKHLTALEMENIKMQRPLQCHKTICFDTVPEDFVQDLKMAFSEDKDFKFGIVGLHPCGDLAAVLLKLFINCPEARFISIVGCCYHKLSTRDLSKDIGFPLSSFADKQYVNISYEARALACHALETYCDRLQSKDYQHLKIHCYRATLEKIIDKNWPELKRSGLMNVKHGEVLTFPQYCHSALRKLNLNVPDEDLESEETISNLSKWQEVVSYYSVRLMLAPLIETVILLDRLLYLQDHDISSQLIAAFDPKVSPRNHILLAEKTK